MDGLFGSFFFVKSALLARNLKIVYIVELTFDVVYLQPT